MDKNTEFDSIFEDIMNGDKEMSVKVIDMNPVEDNGNVMEPIDVTDRAIKELGVPYKAGTLIDDGVFVEHGRYDREEGIVLNSVLTNKQFEGQGLADVVIKQIMDIADANSTKLFVVPLADNQGENEWYASLGFNKHESEDCMFYGGKIEGIV